MNTFCMFPYLYYLVCLWLDGELYAHSECNYVHGRYQYIWTICTVDDECVLDGTYARLFRLMCFPLRVHYRFLLHYILRRGGWRTLGSGYMKRILRDAEGHDEVYELQGDIFNAIGKFVFMRGYDAETGQRVRVVFDRYLFYDWCGNEQHFAHNCTCPKEQRRWSSVLPLEEFIQPIRHIADRIETFGASKWCTPTGGRWLFHIRTWLLKLYHKLDFEVSDKFFSYIGRPFITTGIIDEPWREWEVKAIAYNAKLHNAKLWEAK